MFRCSWSTDRSCVLQKNGTLSSGKLKTSTRWENVFRSCSTADTVWKASLFAFSFCFGFSCTYGQRFTKVPLPPQAIVHAQWWFCAYPWMLMDWGQCFGLIIFSSVIQETFLYLFVTTVHRRFRQNVSQEEQYQKNKAADSKFTYRNICVVLALQSTCSVFIQWIQCVYKQFEQIKGKNISTLWLMGSRLFLPSPQHRLSFPERVISHLVGIISHFCKPLHGVFSPLEAAFPYANLCF